MDKVKKILKLVIDSLILLHDFTANIKHELVLDLLEIKKYVKLRKEFVIFQFTN